MAVILRTISYGAIIGAAFGAVILFVNNFKEHSGVGTSSDAHGYVVFAVMLFGAILGALFGLAASVGTYLKKRFEGESE